MYGDVYSGISMSAVWFGDNGGAIDVATAQDKLDYLKTTYPNANVHISTFDAFFAEANKPDQKKQLPVVTEEIGDGWIYGK